MVTQIKIDLRLPKTWNMCSTRQLELIANIMREQVERQDRYRPFSMQNVKIAVFFALAGIEIIEGPNPRVPVEDQYFTCRLKSDRIQTFSLYLWQINYWLSPKAKTDNKKAAEYVAQGIGLLDWIDNSNGLFLTKFAYPTIKRRRAWWQLKRSFVGPEDDLDGFSWAQYRFASDTMQSYMQISNNLIRMKQMGTFSDIQMKKQAKNADLARAMFLATIFNAKTKFIDTNTGVMRHDYHYESNQCSDNAQYFRDFPDTQWQVILFWWTGIVHSLCHRYPHVYKVQPTQNKTPTTPLEIYTATMATMQKYAGLTEDEVNHQSYSLVLEHLERLSCENEELEKMRHK